VAALGRRDRKACRYHTHATLSAPPSFVFQALDHCLPGMEFFFRNPNLFQRPRTGGPGEPRGSPAGSPSPRFLSASQFAICTAQGGAGARGPVIPPTSHPTEGTCCASVFLQSTCTSVGIFPVFLPWGWRDRDSPVLGRKRPPPNRESFHISRATATPWHGLGADPHLPAPRRAASHRSPP